VPDELAATLQERVALKDTTRAATPEIQVAEEGAGRNPTVGYGER
jgi:hypothetical protein